MAKEAVRRYPTAGDMANDLRRFLKAEPIHAAPIGRIERLWRWSRRNPVPAVLTAAVFLVFSIGFAGVTWNYWRAETAREDLESNLYFQRVALAHREILADNLGESQRLLDACPERLRNWEWSYLKRLSLVDPDQPIVTGQDIFSITFSPDGRRIAAAQGDGKIGIHDPETGARSFLTGHEKYAFSVAFQPQGKYLASAGADRKVILWNLASRQPVFERSGHNGLYTGTAYAVAFSPDGRSFAAASDETTVTIWSVPDGRPLRVLAGHSLLVSCLAFSPSGRLVATGDYGNVVRIWEVGTGTLQRTFEGHMACVAAVAFSPDGQTLASASYDRLVKIWDVATGSHLSTLSGHEGLVVGVEFTRDGNRLATTSARTGPSNYGIP